MKNFTICLALMLTCISCLGQSLPDYKYIIVASKFQAQKVPGQFGLNELTKAFLQKNGYTVYFDSEILPAALTAQSCNRVYADVVERNTMLATKLKVVIKDCRNAVLFTSEEGISKEKDTRMANNKALRMAFQSFDRPEFRYNPANQKTGATAEAELREKAPPATGNPDALFAMPVSNGYKIVDHRQKVVLELNKTSQPEIFMAADGLNSGMLLKRGDLWYFEYYEKDVLVSRPMAINF
jgi:hypothetical protein